MRLRNSPLKSLLLVTIVVVLLNSCASKSTYESERITHEPAIIEAISETHTAPSASKKEKKKVLKRQGNDNDDMERTD